MIIFDTADRAALAAIFAVAVFSKLRSRAAYSAFRSSIVDLLTGPARLRRAAAAMLVASETVILLLLIVPQTASAGLWAACGLLGVMAASLAHLLRDGRPVTCRCFGGHGDRMTFGHVVRNGVLAAAAAIGALEAHYSGTRTQPWILVAGIGIGATLGYLTTHGSDLRYLFIGPPTAPTDRRSAS